ncbi:MAG: hypothetical protein LBD81_00535 [Holosporaceae bacterium]|jgi:hypothetical protein|nr:hypothetical protein [Holosporaceae bacterium]
MAFKSNILENMGKTYDYGLFRKITYFNVGPDDVSKDNDDPTNIPALTAGDDLIIMSLKHPWLTVLDLLTITGSQEFPASTLDFHLYIPVYNPTKSDVNVAPFSRVTTNPLFNVEIEADQAVNTNVEYRAYFHGKLAVNYPEKANIKTEITNSATGESYREAIAYANALTAPTTAAQAKAAMAAYLTLEGTKSTICNRVGRWPTIDAGEIKTDSDAALAVVLTDINNITITDLSLDQYKAAVEAKYTPTLKDKYAAAKVFQSTLFNIEKVTKDSTVPIYLGVRNNAAAAGIPAEVRFALEYSDSGGSNA